MKKLINEALFIIESFGTPIQNLTPRRLEMMALCFISLLRMKKDSNWSSSKGIDEGISMKTRDIINYINQNFQENISLGSYDDIRRKHLKLLVLNEVVVRTKPALSAK